jgi:DNA ligase-1
MNETPFSDLANLCERLRNTPKRNEKVALIAEFLLKIRPEEIGAAVLLIIGYIFPESVSKPLEVSAATIRKVLEKGRQTSLIHKPLSILQVQRTFDGIASATGSGSRHSKERLLEGLLGQASEVESRYILKNTFGEMQIGVVEGVMIEAIAKAAEVDVELVRRANMVLGDLGKVADIALTHGMTGLQDVRLVLFRPLKPMLAEKASDLSQVFREHGGTTALEYKLDGARVQIHKTGDQIRIFSRRLTEATGSLPEIVQLVRDRVNAREALIEGEVVAMGRNQRPLPFQELMRRFKRIHAIKEAVKETPLRLYIFDVLYIDGSSLLDTPYEKRWTILSSMVDPELLAERIVTDDPKCAEAFLEKAMAAGHEGLMAKALQSDYAPGVRGKKWFKIKPADSLDLAIVAADWGYGRRSQWLSDYYLAVLDPETGYFLRVGKTFKGLTDEEFEEMTRRLLSLKVSETKHTVQVRPEVVVEVEFGEVQKSPSNESGVALRFARITRIRTDKGPRDICTLEQIKKKYEDQFRYKASRGNTATD